MAPGSVRRITILRAFPASSGVTLWPEPLRFPENPPARSDKQLESGFLQDAEGILETAQTSASHTDFTILISPEGGIHMLADSDWPLESLARHHGARTLYRVSSHSGRVSVEGR